MDKIKYYVYISDTKVDMLYGQIPPKTRNRIATELSINLKILNAKFSEGEEQETRYSKLRIITDYFDKHEKIGTLDEPESYFRGKLFMRWGPIPTFSYPIHSKFKIDPELIYFAGSTDRTIVGLTGSLRHVIGNSGTSTTSEINGSSLLTLVNTLALEGEFPEDVSHRSINSHVDEIMRDRRYQMSALDDYEMSRFYAATKSMQGPEQKFEFLSKRLLQSHVNKRPEFEYIEDDFFKKQLLIGSPLYVALEE